MEEHTQGHLLLLDAERQSQSDHDLLGGGECARVHEGVEVT